MIRFSATTGCRHARIAVLDPIGHCEQQAGHALAQKAPAALVEQIVRAPEIVKGRHRQSGQIRHHCLHEDESIEGKPKFLPVVQL